MYEGREEHNKRRECCGEARGGVCVRERESVCVCVCVCVCVYVERMRKDCVKRKMY